MSDARNPGLADQLAQFARPRFTPFDPDTGQGLEVAHEPRYGRSIEGGEYAAPASRASYEWGFVFRADHETLADGMCRQARAHAVALAEHAPVLLWTIHNKVRRPVYMDDGTQGDVMEFSLAGDDMLEDSVFRQVGALRRTQVRNYLAAVYHTTIRSSGGLRTLLLPEYTRAAIGAADRLLARSVVYTPWERSTVSREIIDVLKDTGQVWLQCRRNVEVFVEAGLPEKKVRLVPPAFDPEGLVALIPKTRKRVPSGRRFYNIGKWEPRKAQHELIGAFLHTFEPGSDAHLTMKVSWAGEWDEYPKHTQSLPVWLQQPQVRQRGWTAQNVGRHVSVYDKQFSDEQMAKLHAVHNIYVSASHAEGWDYPAFDAATAGNRLVHVGFGGSEDYADEQDVRVPYSLGPVDPQYGWEPGAQWAVYEFDALCAALAPARPREQVELSRDLASQYGAPRVGELMFAALRDLVLACDPSLWAAAEETWNAD